MSLAIHSLKNFKGFIIYHRKALLIASLCIAVLFTILGFCAPKDPTLADNKGLYEPIWTKHDSDDDKEGPSAVDAKSDDWRKVVGFNKTTLNWIDDMVGISFDDKNGNGVKDSGEKNLVEQIADMTQVYYTSNIFHESNGYAWGRGDTSTSGTLTIGNYEVPALSRTITVANDLCKGIAVLFLIITFFLSLLQMRQVDQMDMELGRRLVMLILGFVLIFFSMQWCFALSNLGGMVASKVAETSDFTQSKEVEDTVNTIKTIVWNNANLKAWDHDESGIYFVGPIDVALTNIQNGFTAFGYLLQLMFPHLLMRIAHIIVNVVVWGRAFEIVLMATFSPLAFAQIPDIHQVGHGPGMRFFKNMLALSISGAIIVFTLIMTNAVSFAILSDSIAGKKDFGAVLAGIGYLVIVGLAQCGLIFKASSISKAVVGVG